MRLSRFCAAQISFRGLVVLADSVAFVKVCELTDEGAFHMS